MLKEYIRTRGVEECNRVGGVYYIGIPDAGVEEDM